MKESNHLIEEFMLLANKRVAVRISEAFPGKFYIISSFHLLLLFFQSKIYKDTALLRRHPKPLENKLEQFEALCASLGLTDPSFNLKDPSSLAHSLEALMSIYLNLIFNLIYFIIIFISTFHFIFIF